MCCFLAFVPKHKDCATIVFFFFPLEHPYLSMCCELSLVLDPPLAFSLISSLSQLCVERTKFMDSQESCWGSPPEISASCIFFHMGAESA